MAKLTQEMKDMILAQQCFIATVSKEGIPNNAPKRSTRGMPKPKAVVLVHIEEIYSLKPGPMAGKRIA